MKIIKVSAIWCSGCLSMKKVWREIESEYPDLEIVNYDYDMDSDKVSELNVGKILPVTIFINNGEKRLVGEQTKEQIVDVIKEMI